MTAVDCDRHAESKQVPLAWKVTHGRFSSVGGRPVLVRFFEKIVYGFSDCWYWAGARDPAGYGLFLRTRAHRVSWTLHHGPIPAGLKVLHRCDVRNCVNPEHLFLGTQQDNVADMVAKGRQRGSRHKGESNGGARLTWAIAREARALHAAGRSGNSLARQYEVSVATMWRLLTGASWTNETV